MFCKAKYFIVHLVSVLLYGLYQVAIAAFQTDGVRSLLCDEAGVVGTPPTLSGMGATGIRKVLYDKKLRENSIRPSVFTALKTAMKMDKGIISIDKQGVFMTADTAPTGAGAGQSVRLAMIQPLQEAPRWGTSQTLLGNEEGFRLIWTEAYYNEIKKGTKIWNWGFNYNDTAYLNVNAMVDPKLSEFMAELRDFRTHQALCLRRAEELIQAPLSLSQTPNPNWIIPNLDDASLPAWDKDAATRTDGALDSMGYYNTRYYSGATAFCENVAVSIMAASGTGSTPKNLFNVDTIFYMEEYARQGLMIDPIMLDGQWSYAVLVPSRVKAWMLNPNNAGSLGEYFKSVAEYKDPTRATIPFEYGRLGSLVLIENMRSPTLTIGGSAGSYTLTFGFVLPGNNDDRNNAAWANTSGATNYVHDLVIGLGANALLEYLMDPMNTRLKETTEYEQIVGRAAYLGEGIQIPFWDLDSGSQTDGANKSLVYKGSWLTPVGRTPRVNVT
jgi:hypothetical protein